ncbi:MAG: helix-turn-helix domain-containing protein [Rhodospirillales bacterium]|nr:helix-turn-helix domain-containing protein [Rhodospirillales bacterium]
MSKLQIIYQDNGKAAFVVLPVADYLARFPDADLSDEQLFDLAKAQDDGSRVPHDVMKRLIDCENPVRVYREWRGFTQEELASKTGVSPGYVSQIERGTRHLSRKARNEFAAALGVEASDLDG